MKKDTILIIGAGEPGKTVLSDKATAPTQPIQPTTQSIHEIHTQIPIGMIYGENKLDERTPQQRKADKAKADGLRKHKQTCLKNRLNRKKKNKKK